MQQRGPNAGRKPNVAFPLRRCEPRAVAFSPPRGEGLRRRVDDREAFSLCSLGKWIFDVAWFALSMINIIYLYEGSAGLFPVFIVCTVQSAPRGKPAPEL